ncbi:DUF3995 domain-containing protein [Myroides fluvii]|uniref:DUF3995 domain-containing protein n=1 Tax=Myroides fluvii TaxID=2572594 RepID=UPI00131E50FC|nr:DUF3995 domain-containing protein [Myroides fluvii]
MSGIEGIKAINFLIFLFLGGIHLYWVFGGQWGLNAALPSNAEGVRVLQPGKKGTVGVACCLFVAGLFSSGVITWGTWPFLVIGILFGLRVIGDFRYVGIGKKIKNTPFAQKDATVFIPLCIYLSLSHFFLFYW